MLIYNLPVVFAICIDETPFTTQITCWNRWNMAFFQRL